MTAFVYFVGLRLESGSTCSYLFSCGEAYKGLGKLGTQLNQTISDTIGDIYVPLPQPCRNNGPLCSSWTERRPGSMGWWRRKERLIELLQEKRTALITRAVTRGLDPKRSHEGLRRRVAGRDPGALGHHSELREFVSKCSIGETPSRSLFSVWKGLTIPWLVPRGTCMEPIRLISKVEYVQRIYIREDL